MQDTLSLEELRTLRRDAPRRLFQHLSECQRSFLFGVEDRRAERGGWGGEVRVILNRNIELHFVPGLNDAMEEKEELPQFCVFPDPDRADSVEDTTLRLEDDEEVQGAIFYVDPTEYDQLVGEAERVLERYEDWDAIPDTWFIESPLVSFIERVVLEHSAVRAEREFDFRRGLIGGEPPPEDAREDEALDAGPTFDEDLDEAEEPDDEEPGAKDQHELDGRGADEDDDDGGRPKNFRSIKARF